MEQHAVPQDITGFQFKLVGDWTLKQFAELAFGIIVAYIFASTSWNPLIKWPLAILFGLLGIGLAFVPIEERPLDIWIINFFKAIYKPTYYIWKKGSPALETPPRVTNNAAVQPKEETKPLTVPQTAPVPKPAEGEIKEDAKPGLAENKIPTEEQKWPFNDTVQAQTAYVYVPSSQNQKPQLPEEDKPAAPPLTPPHPPEMKPIEEKPEELSVPKPEPKQEEQSIPATIIEEAKPILPPTPQQEPKIKEEPTVNFLQTPKEPSEVERKTDTIDVENLLRRRTETTTKNEEAFQQKALSVEDLVRMRTEMSSVKEEKSAAKLSESENKLNDLTEKNKGLLLKIDELRNQMFSKSGQDVSDLQKQLDQLLAQKGELLPQIAAARSELVSQRVAPLTTPAYMEPGFVRPPVAKTDQTTVQKTISLTSIPNVINGLVLDSAGNPINGVILLLKDDKGNSVRALRTNKVGQFIASTPIASGTYYLELEKQGFNFDTWQVDLKGEVLTPVEIRAKAQTEETKTVN